MDNELLSLIGLAESGDEKAFADLTVRYKPLIESMGKRYAAKCSSLIYTEDDFIQEAYISFQRSVSKYNTDKNVLFYTFVIM